MLMKIDKAFAYLPSIAINKLTLGSSGGSLCGRLYLYNKYISKNNVLVNGLMGIIDLLEKGHCKNSARHWRLRHKRMGCFFPKRYKGYL